MSAYPLPGWGGRPPHLHHPAPAESLAPDCAWECDGFGKTLSEHVPISTSPAGGRT